MSTKTIERRIITAQVELREAADGSAVLEGHAAVFNEWSHDLGGFREKIEPGAFATSLRDGDDVVALFNHDRNLVLGRRSAKTLTVEEDSRGLKMSVEPPDTQTGRDIVTLVKRGDIKAMSFAFSTVADEWRITADGEPDERILKEVRLHDVSPVTEPAYPQTDIDVAVRMREEWRTENDDETINENADESGGYTEDSEGGYSDEADGNSAEDSSEDSSDAPADDAEEGRSLASAQAIQKQKEAEGK